MIESPSQKHVDAVSAAKSPRPEATNAASQIPPAGSVGGLTQAEAERRLRESGYNELPEKKRNPLLEFLSHFWGTIPWMIEAAAILSALVQQWADLIIILVLLAAVICTQLVAAFIAVFGVGLLPAIGWGWALAVWGYVLAWFFVNDRIKLAAYRIFDPRQSVLASGR